jgi:GTPase SAR1 family protein
LVVVGNKVDLESPDQVPYEEASQYASQLGAIFKYTSAKDGKGVDELFQAVAQQVLNNENNMGSQKASKLKKNSERKKSKCC